MSIDTTFHPITQTILVGATPVQVATDTQLDNTTFRVLCRTAGSFTWGGSGVTAKAAPVAGTPAFNTLSMVTVGSVLYIEVPSNSFFVSAAGSFEITGGKGGVGG